MFPNFDNTLKPGWEHAFLVDMPHLPTYFLFQETEPKDELIEKYEPRQFSEQEILDFRREQQRLRSERKGLLVLDLDHTLVHCTRRKDKELLDPCFTVGDEVWYYYLRPGLAYFLQQMQQCFELVLYTFATRSYAEFLLSVMDSLFPPGHEVKFRAIITRNECIDKKRKSVTELFPEHSMVFVVDDNKGCVWNELDNLIRIPPFYHFGKKAKLCPFDTHLTTLSTVLKKLHHVFFEQKTCQTRIILEKLKELVAKSNPMALQKIAVKAEKKEKHRKHGPKQYYVASKNSRADVNLSDEWSLSGQAASFTEADLKITGEGLAPVKGTIFSIAKEELQLHCGEDERRVFASVALELGNFKHCSSVVLSQDVGQSVNVCS